jgi:HEAT repeat protein
MPEKKETERLVKRFMESNVYNAWDAGFRLKEEGSSSIRPLIDALGSDDVNTRWRSAILLSEFGEEAVEPLITFAQGGEAHSTIAALWALGKIGDVRACDLLIRAASDEDCMIRSTAVEALGALEADQVSAVIMNALNDEDEYVRWHAEEALHRILLR